MIHQAMLLRLAVVCRGAARVFFRRSSKALTGHAAVEIVALIVWGFVLVPLFAPSAFAARVVLKNGAVVEGLIVEDVPEEYIVIRTLDAELRLAYNQIQELDRETREAVEEQLGDQLAQQGKFEEALERYTAARESGSASEQIDEKIAKMRTEIEARELAQYSAQIQAAQDLIDQRRFDEARAALLDLMNSTDKDSVRTRARKMLAHVHYRKAEAAMDVVDYSTAEKELNTSIEYNPDLASAHIELGDLYSARQLGRPRALQEYLIALSLDIADISPAEMNRIRWNIARISHEMGNWDQAIDYYTKVYESNPRYDPRLGESLREVFLRRANSLAEKDDLDGAIETLRTSLQYNPADAEIRYRLAQLLTEEEAYEEGLQELQQLFTIDNRYRNSHYLAAYLLLQQNKVIDAREQLLEEIQTTPNHLDAYCRLGEISLDGGDFPSADQYFRKALEIDPARLSALLGLAKVKRRQDNLIAARQYLDVVLKADPDNREGNLEMGLVLKDEKEYQEARKHFNRVVESLQKQTDRLNKEERDLLAQALNLRAETYILLEQTRTARNDLEEALKYAPDYAPSFYNMGQSYIKESGADEESFRKAEENLLKAYQLSPKSEQFAQGLGIFYHQYMSQRDTTPEKKKEYLQKAVKYYNDYLRLGGPDRENVIKWIEECGGKVESD